MQLANLKDFVLPSQKNHKECDDQTTYFAEQEVYWAPASSYEGLYEQLSRYRYREIPRPQLRYVKP